jgi:hypothetical protein
MQSRKERTVFLFTMLLMLGAFLAGQLYSGDITGAATGDAWDFENANEASDYFNVVKDSLGEDIIDFIISFIMTFAIMYYAAGKAFGGGGGYGDSSGNAAMSIFALAASLLASWYYSSFIIGYLSFFLAVMLGVTLVQYISGLKENKTGYHKLAVYGLGFVAIGLAMFYFEHLGMKGWGAFVVIIGFIVLIVGIIGTMKDWKFGDGSGGGLGGGTNPDFGSHTDRGLASGAGGKPPAVDDYKRDAKGVMTIDELMEDIGIENKEELQAEKLAINLYKAIYRKDFIDAQRIANKEEARLYGLGKRIAERRKKFKKDFKKHLKQENIKRDFNVLYNGLESNVKKRFNLIVRDGDLGLGAGISITGIRYSLQKYFKYAIKKQKHKDNWIGAKGQWTLALRKVGELIKLAKAFREDDNDEEKLLIKLKEMLEKELVGDKTEAQTEADEIRNIKQFDVLLSRISTELNQFAGDVKKLYEAVEKGERIYLKPGTDIHTWLKEFIHDFEEEEYDFKKLYKDAKKLTKVGNKKRLAYIYEMRELFKRFYKELVEQSELLKVSNPRNVLVNRLESDLRRILMVVEYADEKLLKKIELEDISEIKIARAGSLK